MGGFTPEQKAIAIAPKFTSIASVFGSGFMIYDILYHRKRRSCTIHRLLLGMSVSDFLSSSWFFLTSWPIPAGTPNVYGAVGNQASCTAQGFFSQLSLSTAMYNASLSVFYFLQITKGWHRQRIKRTAEPFLHAFALAIGLGTSFAGIPLKLYNNDMWECWIAPFPLDCDESWRNGGKGNCIRGDNASLYRWVLYYALLWAAIVIVTVCMVLVYRSVLAQERVIAKYGSHEKKFSKKVADQGFYYCGAFYFTWFFPTVTRLVQVISGNTPFWLICLTAMFVPVQGLFNFLVYIRPRYKEHRRMRRMVSLTKHAQSFTVRFFSAASRETGVEKESEAYCSQSNPADLPGTSSCSCWNESADTTSRIDRKSTSRLAPGSETSLSVGCGFRDEDASERGCVSQHIKMYDVRPEAALEQINETESLSNEETLSDGDSSHPKTNNASKWAGENSQEEEC